MNQPQSARSDRRSNGSLRPIWLSVALAFAGWPAMAPAQQPVDPAVVERGEYLAKASDCVACHTTRGGKPFAGGLAIALPFGNLYSPNITPDRETGIGTWSDDEFVRAMQEGVGKGDKHLYPAFPYPSFTLMPRQDILAIKAYLFSLPPQKSDIPANTLSFPFDQRYGMVIWNALFNPNKRFQPDQSKPVEWNRGAYLVEGPGHCGECHTPRRLTMNLNTSQKFAGAITQGWKAYNITSDSDSGLGGWSDDALASYLATGHADGHSSAAGPMAEVVENSLRYLTPEDIRAIVVYLKSLPAIRNEPAVATNPPAARNERVPQDFGAKLFVGECANCHLWDGTGAQSPYATLVGNQTVNDPDGTNTIAVLLAGARYHFPRETAYMPPFAARSDDEIAALTNFTNQRFGNQTSRVTAQDVANARHPKMMLIPSWAIWAAMGVAVVFAMLIAWAVSRLFTGRGRSERRPA